MLQYHGGAGYISNSCLSSPYPGRNDVHLSRQDHYTMADPFTSRKQWATLQPEMMK
jgi:hypothetical protein